MKNVTVSLDDDTYRRARVKAAEAGRSLSSIVREQLQAFGHEETEFERLARLEQELYAEIATRTSSGRSADHLSREDLYEEMFRERMPTYMKAHG